MRVFFHYLLHRKVTSGVNVPAVFLNAAAPVCRVVILLDQRLYLVRERENLGVLQVTEGRGGDMLGVKEGSCGPEKRPVRQRTCLGDE